METESLLQFGLIMAAVLLCPYPLLWVGAMLTNKVPTYGMADLRFGKVVVKSTVHGPPESPVTVLTCEDQLTPESKARIQDEWARMMCQDGKKGGHVIMEDGWLSAAEVRALEVPKPSS